MKPLRFALLALTFPLLALSADPAPFLAGVQAWTFKDGTLTEALEKTRAAGGAVLEVFLMGQKLSPERPDVIFDETLSDADLALVRAKCAETGVRIVNAYIGSKQWERIGQDEAALRAIFAFGKRLGVTGYTGEPREDQFDMVERGVKEFDVTFAIHNHIRGFEAPYLGGPYKYWDSAATFALLKGRDPRLGICFDTGHAARSGLDTLATLRAIQGRCLSVHLKDVVAADPDGHDCPYGTGIVPVRALLTELRRQEFRGHIAVEYEWFRSPTFAQDVAGCLAFIRAESAAAGEQVAQL